MTEGYRVVVIGGGIVGCSVAYHLALRGLTDVAVVERDELTVGSTWHAAGGFHAINADTTIAALQKYTIGMYEQVERESGRSVGMHMSGGLELAGTPERWRMLKQELRWHEMMGTDAALLSPAEAAEMVPIIDPAGLEGALFDPNGFNNLGSSLVYGHPQGPTGARLIAEGIEEARMGGGGHVLFAGCAAGDTAAAVVLQVNG